MSVEIHGWAASTLICSKLNVEGGQGLMSSVQPDHLSLPRSDPQAAKAVKDRLERTLRNSLMTLRKKLCSRTTTMNFLGNAVLRKLLPGLEASHRGLSTQNQISTPSHLSELQRIVTSHKVCGFPLHSPFR